MKTFPEVNPYSSASQATQQNESPAAPLQYAPSTYRRLPGTAHGAGITNERTLLASWKRQDLANFYRDQRSNRRH